MFVVCTDSAEQQLYSSSILHSYQHIVRYKILENGYWNPPPLSLFFYRVYMMRQSLICCRSARSCCTRPLVCPRCNGWAPPLFCPSRNTRPRTCYNSYTIPQVIQNRLIFIKNLGQTSRIQIHEIKTNFGKLRPFRSVPSPIML